MHGDAVYKRRYDESTQQTNANTCPDCDGRVTMTCAEVVCDDCGLILADGEVDCGPEWRNFDGAESQKRTGAPRTPSRHDRGLSTTIGCGRDAQGRRLDSKTRRRLARLRREHRRAKQGSTAERNEAYGLTQIRRMASALGLGKSLRDQACRLFSSAQEAGLLPGRSIEAMSAAAVYATCRCNGRPETSDDVASVAQATQAHVRNAYTALNRELGLPTPPRTPETFLPKLVSTLELSRGVERRARDVLQGGTQLLEGTGANPVGVAAGAILVAATELGRRDQFTQSELAAAANVTPVTIRNHRRSLEHTL